MSGTSPFVQDGDLLQVMRGFNPWWQAGEVPAPKQYRRVAFYEAQRWLTRADVRRAVMLSGARRVGKTTILHQLADDALGEGLAPRHCLYLSFDHPLLKLADMARLVDLFRSQVAGGAEEILLLLDEVHYASDWSSWLKWVVDTLSRARVVATGSASTLLRGQGQESGAGRWLEVSVPTLSFYEYAHLCNLAVPDLPRSIVPTRLPDLRPSQAEEILNLCLPLRPHLPRYLLQGGFPESAMVTDLDSAQRIVREDVVDRVLKRDMTALYGIRSVLELERLFVYLCLHSGGILAQEPVATQLGITRPTLGKLLAALEAANLNFRCLPIDLGGKKALKPRTKVYLADPSIRGAVLLKGEEALLDPVEAGLIVETAVFQHIRAFYYPRRMSVGYWRGGDDREVDVVVHLPPSWTTAVEVKYREDVSGQTRGLDALAASTPLSARLMVTKHPSQFGPLSPAGTFQIPAFLFLYLMGHAERRAVDEPGLLRRP